MDLIVFILLQFSETMSSRGPPSKRRKTSKASVTSTSTVSNRKTSKASATSTSTESNQNGQPLQDLVAALIPALIPAITRGVVASLQDMGVINTSQHQKQVQNEQHARSDQATDSVDQGTKALDDSSSSTVIAPSPANIPSVQASSINTENTSINEASDVCHYKNKAISMARPLDLGIDSKIKGKIWANQFVELNSLLTTKRKERIELVDNGDGVIRCKKSNTGSITSIDKWLEAFHVFVAIYTAKYPTEAPSLMKHTKIVQKLAKQAGDEAALFYDEQFRLWREDQPELLPWGLISSELQNEALAMGFSKNIKQNPAGQRKPKSGIKKYCFRFINQNGQCPKGADCSFPHICQKCGGPHSRRQCPKLPITGNPSNNPPANNPNPKRPGPATPAPKS